jgi:hypothetical protein
MATPAARRARLAADVTELRAILQTARDDLRALPPAASRTPAQKATARSRRVEQLVARILLNTLATPTDDDLTD